MLTPKIEPIKIKEYTVKQYDSGVVGPCPIRSVILGPSGPGKTVLLQNMILDMYEACLYYIFSTSIYADNSWVPVKK